jgi:hypothetical protein
MGFEPTYTALQAAASPLGHSTATCSDAPEGAVESGPPSG